MGVVWSCPVCSSRPTPPGHAHGLSASVHTRARAGVLLTAPVPLPGKPRGKPGPRLVGSQAQHFRAGFHSAWKPAAWKKAAAWEALQPPKSFFGFTGLASTAPLAGRGPGWGSRTLSQPPGSAGAACLGCVHKCPWGTVLGVTRSRNTRNLGERAESRGLDLKDRGRPSKSESGLETPKVTEPPVAPGGPKGPEPGPTCRCLHGQGRVSCTLARFHLSPAEVVALAWGCTLLGPRSLPSPLPPPPTHLPRAWIGLMSPACSACARPGTWSRAWCSPWSRASTSSTTSWTRPWPTRPAPASLTGIGRAHV